MTRFREPWPDALCGRDCTGVHACRALADIGGIHQPGDRHLDEIGVARVLGAVGVHALGDLGYQVHVLGRIVRRAREVVGSRIFHSQELQQCEAARTRRRRRQQRLVAPGAAQRFTPYCAVCAQVVRRDQPATPLHLTDDQVCSLAFVEAGWTGILNSPEGCGQFGLPEPCVMTQAAKILREVGVLETRLFCRGPLSQQGWNLEPALRQLHGGLDDLAPRQLAVTPMRFPESCHGTGHADGAVSRQAQACDHLAPGIEVHVARRGRGGRLAVVEELCGAIDAGQHEATAAQVAGFRISHRQHEGAGHGCIDGVAPGRQDVGSDVGAERVRHRDCAAQPARHGLGQGGLSRTGAGRAGGQQRDAGKDKRATKQVHAQSIKAGEVEILTQKRRPVPARRVSAVRLSIIEDKGQPPVPAPAATGSSSAHVRRNIHEYGCH